MVKNGAENEDENRNEVSNNEDLVERIKNFNKKSFYTSKNFKKKSLEKFLNQDNHGENQDRVWRPGEKKLSQSLMI